MRLTRRITARSSARRGDSSASTSRVRAVDDSMTPMSFCGPAIRFCSAGLQACCRHGRAEALRYSTILFNGYSTSLSARELQTGIRSRTVFSSMMVLTATHS
jgi:hypothetical protein